MPDADQNKSVMHSGLFLSIFFFFFFFILKLNVDQGVVRTWLSRLPIT